MNVNNTYIYIDRSSWTKSRHILEWKQLRENSLRGVPLLKLGIAVNSKWNVHGNSLVSCTRGRPHAEALCGSTAAGNRNHNRGAGQPPSKTKNGRVCMWEDSCLYFCVLLFVCGCLIILCCLGVASWLHIRRTT